MVEGRLGDLILLLAVVLPGFLSVQVYRRILPSERFSFREDILEAIAFGAVNFALMFWVIVWVTSDIVERSVTLYGYLAVIAIFFIAPIIWPFLLDRVLTLCESWGWFIRRSKNSWDDFFVRRESCFIIVHLHDRRRIGGKWSEHSSASLYPHSGHLYIEELYELREDSSFGNPIKDSKGVILRPEDYHFIEIMKPGEEEDVGQKTDKTPS